MSNRHFILDNDKRVVPVSATRWAMWFGTADHRRVKKTELANATVSTVFLGLDHRFGSKGPPLVFETMVFNADGDEDGCWRYSSWDDAVTGHQAVVSRLKREKA